VEAERHRDQGQRLERSRHASPAARGRRERQSADARRRVVRELLRHRAAQREAEDVGLFVAELVEQRRDHPRERRDRERPPRRRRVAAPRELDRDRVARGREALLERLEHLEGPAEAVDQEQRPALPALAHEELDPSRGHRRPGRLLT
jgi:hypothetical protein